MSLDIRTLSFCIAAASVVAAMVLLAYWRTQRTYPGFGFWVTANLLVSTSFVLFGLRDSLPGPAPVLLANVAGMAAVALRLESVRHFYGKRGFGFQSTVTILCVAPFVAYFTFIREDIAWRTLIASTIVALFAILIAWAFVQGATRGRVVVAGILATLHVYSGALLLVRAIVWVFVPEERGIFTASPLNLLYFFSQLLVDIGISVAFVALHAERATTDLEESQRKLEALASTDALTGALNRRTFFYRAETEYARARRLHQPLAVLMLDLDLFKQVNDTRGHAAGDAALRHVITVVGRQLREIDRIGRLGGEEFAVLLPGAEIAGAEAAAERLRVAVAESPISAEDATFHLTVSIGVAELCPSDTDVDAFLKRSDEALYDAKRKGRNVVVAAMPPALLSAAPPTRDGLETDEQPSAATI